MTKYSRIILLILLVILVLKSVLLSPLNLAESLVTIGLIAFKAYDLFMANKKTEEIKEDYNKRLSDIESRIALFGLNRNNKF